MLKEADFRALCAQQPNALEERYENKKIVRSWTIGRKKAFALWHSAARRCRRRGCYAIVSFFRTLRAKSRCSATARSMRVVTVLLALVVLLVTPRASADRVPDSAVQLRIVERDDVGFLVEVTNPSDAVARFDAIGLYFLPSSKEEPQRLGVVSAGQIQTAGRWTDTSDIVDVAPHASIRIELTTYCLDAHRVRPSDTVAYHLASRRMPTALAGALAGAARMVAHEQSTPSHGEELTSARQSEQAHNLVQQAVWTTRDRMPVSLLGDRP